MTLAQILSALQQNNNAVISLAFEELNQKNNYSGKFRKSQCFWGKTHWLKVARDIKAQMAFYVAKAIIVESIDAGSMEMRIRRTQTGIAGRIANKVNNRERWNEKENDWLDIDQQAELFAHVLTPAEIEYAVDMLGVIRTLKQAYTFLLSITHTLKYF